MDSTPLALLALAIGVIFGGGVSAIVVIALRARDRQRLAASADIPDGVRQVLRGLDDAAIVIDGSTTVLAASPQATPFGMQEGEVIRSDELRALARSAREARGSATETLRLRRGTPPVEPRLVAARATKISERLILLVFRDITERERVEEMRRDFVANTSHELKTPVGAVSLLAEAIISAADDPDQVRNFASRLSAEATRLAGLTSRIMSLSRLQAADELNDDREVPVDEVVASAIDAHLLQADSAGVEVLRGGDRRLYVRGDAQVLSEAVGNLLANAIAYSPRGSSVGVGVRGVADVVEIAVTDRGIGISEADQQRIFERFYRADQARSRRTGGTGLGLSIVKYAVQRHGGEVKLWSRPGRGSTFTIRLPLVDAPVDPTERKKKRERKKKSSSSGSAAAASATPAGAASVPETFRTRSSNGDTA
ncbi:sensor histidine kinase [Microbacterium sp. CJ88]|uniref:sensor histidine kinase n=1 Tax=Microbacterium sp. CJ88 TaxID=3445672 RepID=UPI003F66080E